MVFLQLLSEIVIRTQFVFVLAPLRVFVVVANLAVGVATVPGVLLAEAALLLVAFTIDDLRVFADAVAITAAAFVGFDV
jgi:hypothetical protein